MEKKLGYFTKSQNGITTLIFAIFLIIAISLVTLLGTRSSIFDIKIQTNEYEQKLAFEAAQYGLEQGVAYLSKNFSMIRNSTDPNGWMTGTPKWSPCTGTDITLPCGDEKTALYGSETLAYKNVNNLVAISTVPGVAFSVHYLTQKDPILGNPPPFPLVTIIAKGLANNGRAVSIVQQSIRTKNIFANQPNGPILSNGNVLGTGNINIWGAETNGDVLSIWSKGATMPLSGSAVTYDVTVPTGQYPQTTSILSYDTTNGGDIIDNDPNFPPDLFYYMFGVPKSQDTLIKNISTVYDNCTTLDSSSSGLIWITGNCKLNNSTGPNIGSLENPVMLIISGELRMSGTISIFGGIYLRDSSPNVTIVGTINVFGFLAVDKDIDFGGGDVNFVAQETVLNNLQNNLARFAYIPGSWNDAI